MPHCAAPNCTNAANKGYKMLVFPKDPSRRKQWVINCRRDKWEPTNSSYLCETHFEKSQFEQNRQDGRKKLKPNGIPTLFDVPNAPKRLEVNRKRNAASLAKIETIEECERPMDTGPGFMHSYTKPPMELLKSADVEDAVACESHDPPPAPDACQNCEALKLEIRRLRRQIDNLIKQQDSMVSSISGVFNTDQIEAMKLPQGSKNVRWSHVTVREAMQLRCVLGVTGYNFLREKSYPLPTLRTLCYRFQNLEFSPGIQETIIDLLAVKLSQMKPEERHAVLAVDEVHRA
ncbi:PREDICTED: THAP domain-containing protein 4-like [Priapulus caudatus]|uniref:THAP domain-containing protein 4-like n=1 Tax=Priapulus caudatus TaxID=37621 RepID=A0ABM1EL66_PRICU|nr:PREDICTED: THAP domain-containing protein 4-like [Priapulus caudatus]